MTKREAKDLDSKIERIYYRHGDGVQINVMDICKIFKAGKEAFLKGEDMEAAIVAAIATYRLN